MKKRIISITIFVIMVMSFIFGVKAKTEYTAASVNENLEKYRNAINEMTTLKCNNELYNQITVDKCNSLSLKKANALAYLFNARQSDESLMTDEIEKVLEENSSECNTIFSNELQDIVKKAFLLFYIAGPILLILFGTLDMTNAIIAGDEKRRKALFTKFVKRSIALILLFATPAIVNLLVNIFGAKKYSESSYTCNYEEKQLTLVYTKRQIIKKGGNSEDYGRDYGPSTGSTVVSLDSTSDRDAGEYVVISTNYPGSVKGYSDMLIRNGICQTSTGQNKACISSSHAPNGWGDCCAGIAQIQACGVKKGMELSQAKAGLIVGNKGCNNPSNSLGCTGVWVWNNDTCFATEAEYVQFVIKNIQEGIPVLTLAGTSSRHFITIVGFKNNTSGTSHEDLLLLDSWDGRLETFKKRKIGVKSNIGNHPCNGHNGEYWASPLKY